MSWNTPLDEEPTPVRLIESIAHRTAWRYKKSGDPHHSDTYTFTRSTLLHFVEALQAAAPQAPAQAPTVQHMCQDIDPKLSKALAATPGARLHATEAAAAIATVQPLSGDLKDAASTCLAALAEQGDMRTFDELLDDLVHRARWERDADVAAEREQCQRMCLIMSFEFSAHSGERDALMRAAARLGMPEYRAERANGIPAATSGTADAAAAAFAELQARDAARIAALPPGACRACEGEGWIGGQFSSGPVACDACSGTGTAATSGTDGDNDQLERGPL